MADGHDPAGEDLMSLVRTAVPRQTDGLATAQAETQPEDTSLDDTRAALQVALDSEGSGTVDVATPELDSLLAELDDTPSEPTRPDASDPGSGMIVVAELVGSAPA